MDNSDRKILIVDDERVARRILGAMIQRLGYSTIEADGCESARESFTEELLALIFLDIEMGEESGLEFCSWVREQESGADIPIVMGTSHNEREFVLRAVNAGADDFVIKPFQALTIKERLEKHLKT